MFALVFLLSMFMVVEVFVVLFGCFGELSSLVVDVFLMIRLDQSSQCASGHVKCMAYQYDCHC